MTIAEAKKNPRRWVIATVRDSGASEAQFPLPVTIVPERTLFRKDVPQVIPFEFVVTLRTAILPKYEIVNSSEAIPAGRGQRSLDQARFVGIKYQVETVEIPLEYQTEEGINTFVNEVLPSSPDWTEYKDARMEINSIPSWSIEYSRLVQKALAEKGEEKKTEEKKSEPHAPKAEGRKRDPLTL